MSETTNAAEESARIRAEFTVEGALAGMRLDAALAGALDAPRTRTSGWIRDGHVTVTNNGKTVKIGKSYKLSAGDEVVVDAPAPRDLADIRPEKVDGFRIVHLDEDIVVVDKPAGVAAHPSPGWHPPSSPRSWARAFRLLPPVRQNARALCTAWTWAPAA